MQPLQEALADVFLQEAFGQMLVERRPRPLAEAVIVEHGARRTDDPQTVGNSPSASSA